MKTLLVLGLSAVWERGLRFQQLRLGEVNRAVEKWEYASGKATNVCRALATCGCDCQPILLTLLGGHNGQRFQEACRDENLLFKSIETRAETRVCTNILSEGNDMTELVEEGAPITEKEAEKFLEALDAILPECDGVALAGNIPPGSPENLPTEIAKRIAAAEKTLFLDNWKAFREMAACGGKIVLKINAGELAKITGVSDLQQGIQSLAKEFPDMLFGITDGMKPAWLKMPGNDTPQSFDITPANPLVNALGAGDTTDGVFFGELLTDIPPETAFRHALDAASLSCTNPIAGLILDA